MAPVHRTGVLVKSADREVICCIIRPKAAAFPSTSQKAAIGGEIDEATRPCSTTSRYFLDEVGMPGPGARTIVALGDSTTDGTALALNGDDRWPDVFSRRFHTRFGNRYSAVNAGIGGNMVVGWADYAGKPFAGGPAATERLNHDVLAPRAVSAVTWPEGINNFGTGGYEPQNVEDGLRDVTRQLRARILGVKVFMATLTSTVNSMNGGYGAGAIEEKRRAYNDFIRSVGVFGGIVDFDAATRDGEAGELRIE